MVTVRSVLTPRSISRVSWRGRMGVEEDGGRARIVGRRGRRGTTGFMIVVCDARYLFGH